jgi:hypothetical protein
MFFSFFKELTNLKALEFCSPAPSQDNAARDPEPTQERDLLKAARELIAELRLCGAKNLAVQPVLPHETQ